MARGKLHHVLQDPEGDVQTATAVTIYEQDGTTPFAGTLYDAPSGGSIVSSPRTNSLGELELYTAVPKRANVAVGAGAQKHSAFDPDPYDTLIQGYTVPATLDGVNDAASWTLTLRNQQAAGQALRVRNAGNTADLLAVSTAGVQGGNLPVTLDGLASASAYALTVQNDASGGTGSKALLVKNAAGGKVLEIAALGGGGPHETVVGSHFDTSSGVVSIGNLRNWRDDGDLFISHTRLSGSPTLSFVPVIMNYNAVTQPTDGFNGVANIPDEVVLSVVGQAFNVAAGGSQNYDGSMRAAELQTIVYANTGKTRTMAGLEVGCHTAVSKTCVLETPTPDNPYGDCGIFCHSTVQGFPGFGTSTRANIGVVVGGGIGWKYGFAYLGTTNERLWSVDQTGEHWAGNIMPRPGGSFTVGSSTRIWGQVWAGTVIAGAGAASNPSLALGTAGTEGLFQASGVLGFAVSTVERGRFDTTAFQVAQGQRYTGVISPTQITATQNDYTPTGLATARVVKLTADAARTITGLAAQPVGTVISLLNTSSFAITLSHEGAGSAGANRFNLPGGDLVLATHGAVELWYDPSSRWKKLSG